MSYNPEVAEQLKEWGLTPEEMTQVEAVLGKPERQEKIKGSALRQGEFSRKMQALDKQKQEQEAAIAEKERVVAEDAASLGTWKQTADKTIIENQKALEEAKVKAYRLEQKMASLAVQQGVDPKEWGLDGELKPTETKIDPSKLDDRYLAREDAEKLAGELKSAPFIAAEVEDIVDEHRALFGKGLNRRELIANAVKNKRSLRDEWETVNEVGKKRDELKEAQIEAKFKAKYDEKEMQLRSEHKLPVNRGGSDAGSPILAMRENLALAGKDRSTDTKTVSAVDAAVASYNTGKYRGTATAVPEKTG